MLPENEQAIAAQLFDATHRVVEGRQIIPLGNTLREREIKREAVRRAICELGNLSCRWIAEITGTTHGFVNKIRAQMERNGSAAAISETRCGIDGRKRKMPSKKNSKPRGRKRPAGATELCLPIELL